MREGSLVKCLDTQRVGVILDESCTDVATYFLVMWNNEKKACWVDAAEIELLSIR